MSKSETRSASLKTLWGEIQVLWVYEIHWLAFGMRDCFRSVFPDVTRGFCWSRAGVLESSSLCGPDRDQEGIVRGLGAGERFECSMGEVLAGFEDEAFKFGNAAGVGGFLFEDLLRHKV
jgi:hypothetical protein